MTAQLADDGSEFIDMNAIVTANIRALAARRGETQLSLAKQLGITSAAMSLRFRMKRQWPINEVSRIAAVLGVPPWELFEPVGYAESPYLREVGAGEPLPIQQYTARDSNPEPTD